MLAFQTHKRHILGQIYMYRNALTRLSALVRDLELLDAPSAAQEVPETDTKITKSPCIPSNGTEGVSRLLPQTQQYPLRDNNFSSVEKEFSNAVACGWHSFCLKTPPLIFSSSCENCTSGQGIPPPPLMWASPGGGTCLQETRTGKG